MYKKKIFFLKKYMIFGPRFTAQLCAVCDCHRVLYSLCCVFLSPVLTHRATISWKRVNHSPCLGRRQGRRFLEPTGPAGSISLSLRGHGQLHVPTQERIPSFPTRAITEECTFKRQPCFYKEPVSAIFNTCSN